MTRRVAIVAAASLAWPCAAAGQTFSISDPENTGPGPAATTEAEPPRFQTTLFRGDWTSRLAMDTGHEDNCSERACEDVFEVRNQLDLRLQSDLRDDLRVVIEARRALVAGP